MGARAFLLGMWLAACGGKAVVDGNGGAGGTPGTTTGGGQSPMTTGPMGCTDHSQCPGGVCIFSTGTCSESCQECEPCGGGLRCDECATSSCSKCNDCRPACVLNEPGRCDDHDDCNFGEVCLYGLQQCAPSCDAMGACADPNLFCDFCATSTCPCCDSCAGACIAP